VAFSSRNPSPAHMESSLRDMHRQVKQLSSLQEKLSDLVGKAESPDGRIRVECTVAQTPAKLDLDPRAMRMGSQELAEAITALIQEATQDLQRQVREELAGSFDGKGLEAGRREAREQMTEALSNFRRVAADATDELEGMRRNLSGQNTYPPRSRY
jgi:DNA-binding protein YbaB